jgi:hypothetical protein
MQFFDIINFVRGNNITSSASQKRLFVEKKHRFFILVWLCAIFMAKKLVHNTNVLRHDGAKQSKVFDAASENCKINLTAAS